MLAVGAVAVAGCGGTTHTYANEAPPPVPVSLTVYINDARVSVSPGEVGIGPAEFVVTNRASTAESLTVESPGPNGGQPLANTGPINPQGTASVKVDFKRQGDYKVSAAHGGSTEASTVSPSSIAPATIHIGPQRASSRGNTLTP